MSRSRIHYMDATRSVLMMLGVVLHSAQIYNFERSWVIYSESSSELAYYLQHVIHIFRMPAFFVISGFFCLLTLRKYQPKHFLSVRLKRIIIPVISTALTLNVLQAVILDHYGWQPFKLNAYFLQAGWVSHLWFLNNLIIYFICAAGMFFIFNRLLPFLKEGIKKVIDFIFSLPMVIILLCLPFSQIIILSLNKIGFPLYSNLFGIFEIYSLLSYLPYFIFGALLSIKNSYLTRFSNMNIFLLISLIIAVAGVKHLLPDFNGLINEVKNVCLHDLIVWLSIAMVFNIFCRWFNTSSSTWRFLSDASYSVYLFHHILVVILGLLFIQWGVNSHLGFVLLIPIILVLTLMMHYYCISKIQWLRFLFNGK